MAVSAPSRSTGGCPLRPGRASERDLRGLTFSEERLPVLCLNSRCCVCWELSMPRTGWTPSLAPKGDDPTVYLVVDDFGRNGRIFREADIEATDLDTVAADLLDGQYKNSLRVVALNTAEGWSQDVSSEIAQELRRR